MLESKAGRRLLVVMDRILCSLERVRWGEIAKLRLTTGATEDDLGSTFAPWADTEESRIGQFVKDLEAKTVFAGFSWARSRSAFWGGRRLHWADYLSRNFLQLVSHLGNP